MKNGDTRNGAALIAEERQRQIDQEGWTAEHDDQHGNAELLEAAIAYVATAIPRSVRNIRPSFWWPVDWDLRYFKPKDSIANLVKAGALIAAEIDRLQRLDAYPYCICPLGDGPTVNPNNICGICGKPRRAR